VTTDLQPLVCVVDDEDPVRQALGQLLEMAGYRVEVYHSAEAFLARGNPDGISCLILDLQMPGVGGLGLQEMLVGTDNAPPIVFISAYGDIPKSVEAMKKGAVDFLTKPFQPKTILDAVTQAVDRAAGQRTSREKIADIRRRIESLTPREYEVLTHVIAGMLNKQIAYALGISERTVKIHRGRAMRKMEVESLAEVVRLCEQAGIAPSSARSSQDC
jgi:FixJ family two-component response regulator